MNELPTDPLVTNALGRSVPATVVKLSYQDGDWIDKNWWDHPRISEAATLPDDEDDRHWRWGALITEKQHLYEWETIGLGIAGLIEGAAQYCLGAESMIEQGATTVYLDRIAAAPLNRKKLFDPPQYQGIGSALITYIVAYSYKLGLGGRVSLSSLPSQAVRGYYEAIGFTLVEAGHIGFAEVDEGCIGYELFPEEAQAYLERRRVFS